MMNAIRLHAKTENLGFFLQFISDLLISNGFPAKRVQEIEIAAEEILVNIIRYAYPEGGPGEVEIRGRTESGGDIFLDFEDNGAPFDPTSIPPPKLGKSVWEREAGGLGVFLAREMVNEMRYCREGERNILTFIVRQSKGGT